MNVFHSIEGTLTKRTRMMFKECFRGMNTINKYIMNIYVLNGKEKSRSRYHRVFRWNTRRGMLEGIILSPHE